MSGSSFYPSDLTEAEWSLLEPILRAGWSTNPRQGRPPSWPLRQILDAVFYVVRGGIAWRMLPLDFPPWQTVYAWFRKWLRDGTWVTACDRGNASMRRCASAAA